MDTRTTGRRGEEIAAAFLYHLGWEIRGTNVRVGRRDEIDIIAHDPRDDVLVFTEVKSRTRSTHAFHGELNITPVKKSAMHRAALQWIPRL